MDAQAAFSKRQRADTDMSLSAVRNMVKQLNAVTLLTATVVPPLAKGRHAVPFILQRCLTSVQLGILELSVL